MNFEVEFSAAASRYLRRLDVPTQRRIKAAIHSLAGDPFGLNTKPLQARPERSLRVGGWRVLYLVDTGQGVVTITVISPRGEAYQRN